MKTKLYRVLVLLLAIAMMIPSFAMAEGETFEIKPKTDAPKQYYIVGGSTAIAGDDLGTYTVASLPKDLQTAKIKWTSSNPNVASVMPETPVPKDVADQPLPTITKMGIGEATITGELIVNNEPTGKKATFPVKIEAKALKTFKFKDDAKTKFNLDKSTDVSYDLYDQLLVEADDAEGSSYTKADVNWELTSDSQYAELLLQKDNNGKVIGATVSFNKDAIKAATTVTVKASIGTTHEATWKAQVIPASEQAQPETQTKGYETVAFTAPKVYITDSSINLLAKETEYWAKMEQYSGLEDENHKRYLVDGQQTWFQKTTITGSLLNLLPADVVPMNDPLTWTGTTPTAQVPISNKGVVNFVNQYGEVEVTVKSTINKKEAKITVVRLSPEYEVVPFETLTFDPTELPIRSTESIDVNDYLTTVPVASKVKNDHLVYESSDTSIASVSTDGEITAKVGEGEVTIHVFSYLNPAIGADLKIKFVKAAEDSKYESLTFSKSTFDFKINENDDTVSFDANDYLTTVPAQKPVNEFLTWTSNKSDVADVSDTTGVVTLQGKAGTATIKVENKDKSVFAAITVNVEVVKNPYKAITVSAEAQKGLTIEEGETIDLMDYLTPELTRAGVETNDVLTVVVDNTKTATVTMPSIDEDTGAITAVLTGKKASDKPVTVTIRNSTGSVKAEIKVTVEKPKTVSYTSLKFDTAELTVPKNFPDIDVEERHLIAVEPDDFNDNSGLIWKSSNEKVAYFADSTVGTLTIAKPGTTEISVRNGDNTVKSENVLKITVVDAEPFTEVTAIESAKTVYTTISKTCKLTNLVHTEGGYNDSLIWTPDNQQIALVSNNGVVTVQDDAKNGDTVKITARSKWDKNKTATITLTIDTNQIAIKSITLTQDTFELEPKGTLYLDRYVVTDPVEHNDTLIYTSDDPSVVMHNNNEAAYDAALYEDGEAHITVRSTLNPDVSAKFTIKLKAKGADSIAFKDAPKTFYKEMNTLEEMNTLNLWDYLVTKPADYVDSGNLVWESSDPTVALPYHYQRWVDGEMENVYGYLTYVQPGNVTITVTDKVSGKSAKVDLVLKEKHPVESIALKDITMDYEDYIQVLENFLTYAPLNANFSTNNIKWTSSNRDVAEVVDYDEKLKKDETRRDNTRGPILRAYKAGTTKITAYYELEDGKVLEATATVTVNDVELEKVKIAEDKYTLKLNTKMDAVVRFNVEPFNCTFEKEDLYVISADPEIVEVSEIKVDTESHKGKFTITGKKPGTAWVVVKRAKDDKALDACKVKVKAVAVKSVGWEKKNVKMYYYDDGRDKDPTTVIKVVQAPNTVYKNLLKVKPIINPSKAYCNVSFETSDPSVAFINDNNVVDFLNGETPSVDLICMGPGKCKITMKVDDGKKVRKAVMNVEVLTKLPKMKMSQSKATLKLEKGKDTLQLRAYDANTDTDMDVKWTSSNKKVVKVNAEGKVRAIAAGTATITATTKNGQKQVVKCKITVKAPSTKNDAAKKITGDTKVTVKAGEKKTLEIKVKPEGAKVTFTSSDSKIVKVTKDGTIKGIKAGKATITVKAAEGKAELKIKVTVK